jgi:zinc protease
MSGFLRTLCHAMKITTLVALPVLSFSSVSAEEKESPPPPSAPRPVQFPKPAEKTLPNGLRVVVVGREGMPLVSARLQVLNGCEIDPPDLAGLGKLTASLLTEGTESRTAPQIAEAVDALGASLSSDARWDLSFASVNGLSSKFEPALEILADVVRHPAFKQEEIDRIRKQTLDDLSIDLSEPRTIARYVASRVVFGTAAYGHVMQGTPESLPKIRREDLLAVHAKYYRPDNAVLIIGGNIGAEQAFAAAERFFGDWKKPSEPLPAREAQSLPKGGGRVIVIDKSDAGQAAVYIARPGLRRTDPDAYPGMVANAVLGGGYSSRLNLEVRVKRGLSYGANSVVELRRDVGPFVAVAQTKNESGAEVAGLMLGEIEKLAKEAVPADELTPRKASLTGNYARDLETIDGLVAEVGRLALYGLGFDEINKYVGSIEAVKAEEIQKLFAERLTAAGANVVVVGNAKQFLEGLKKKFKDVEVIPEAELDLDSSGLRKKT